MKRKHLNFLRTTFSRKRTAVCLARNHVYLSNSYKLAVSTRGTNFHVLLLLWVSWMAWCSKVQEYHEQFEKICLEHFTTNPRARVSSHVLMLYINKDPAYKQQQKQSKTRRHLQYGIIFFSLESVTFCEYWCMWSDMDTLHEVHVLRTSFASAGLVQKVHRDTLGRFQFGRCDSDRVTSLQALNVYLFLHV